jgi:hypothetical protein
VNFPSNKTSTADESQPAIEDRADFTFLDNGSIYRDDSEVGTRGLRQFRTL